MENIEKARARIEELEDRVAKLEAELVRANRQNAAQAPHEIVVSDIEMKWDRARGTCTFDGLPVTMMWVDTTLAGLMSGVHTMVGTKRFALALQSEGRKSVEADWQVIEHFDCFEDGFAAIANVAAVAGWGRWTLRRFEPDSKTCVFRAYGSWESRLEDVLGPAAGCNMLAGKLAGYASRLFGQNCWAEQSQGGDDAGQYVEFIVRPSDKNIENEIERLLATDEATRADMAVALQKLRTEVDKRVKIEAELRSIKDDLERRVLERTEALERAIEKIGEREFAWRSLIQASPLGIHMYELRGNNDLVFTGANSTADRMLGVSHDELIGKTIEEAFPYFAETPIPDTYRNVCRTGKPWKADHLDYEGEQIRGSYEVHAFQTGDKKMAVKFLDITERIQAAKDKEQLQAELHRSRKMEALGLLAGGVAHDLNNILSGIVSYPELLIAMVPKDSPLIPPLQVVENSGKRAVAVIQDLLTIARGAATARKVVNLNDLIECYVTSPEFKQLSRLHPSVALVRQPNPTLLNLCGSEIHILKALMNLVTNAFEAINNEGHIRISTQNCYVDKPLKGYDKVEIGEYVLLAIEDDGPGIGEGDLERIFEPFFTRKVLGRSGTGLGLAVVWNTLKDHDGYINVSSSPCGTTFELYFPATREKAEREEDREVQGSARGHGESVLVIDDEPAQRTITTQILEALGYVARAVGGGVEAVEYLKENLVDLVVLDMIMPAGLSGRDTYRQLIELQPGLPAIIVSGYAKTEEVKAAQAMGAGKFLKKPFSMNELATAIKEEFGRVGKKSTPAV